MSCTVIRTLLTMMVQRCTGGRVASTRQRDRLNLPASATPVGDLMEFHTEIHLQSLPANNQAGRLHRQISDVNVPCGNLLLRREFREAKRPKHKI